MTINRRTFIKAGSLTTTSLAFTGIIGRAKAGGLQHFWEGVEEALAADTLAEVFLDPSDEARASCYWWWFNGNVDKEGITRDLEEFRAKGMGSVFLINSASGLGGSSPIPQGAKFLSPEWKELYRFALSEAARLHLEVGINLCAGWAMGGPWIQPEDAGRWFLQSELVVTGPQAFSGPLPLPGGRSGYDHVFNPPGYKEYIDLPLERLDYRDTAVVAFRLPDAEGYTFTGERAKALAAKTNRKDASNFTQARDVMGPTLAEWVTSPSDQPIAAESVLDLTSQMTPDGRLTWQVPEGRWKIIRTGHRMTGSRLMLAPPEADGLSVGWLNSRGLEQQFEHLGKVLLQEAGPLAGKTLKYFSDDSFEDGFPNWTAEILQKFREYRGYEAIPYLPVLAGVIVGSAEISDRFLHDYRKTVADLMADAHYKRFAELCHQHGLLVQNESAGPSRSGTMCMDGLKNLGRSDLPMGEFWLGLRHDEEGGLDPKLGYGTTRLEDGQNKVTKMVASAAHIYGKKLASAEAFTTYRHWSDSPATLKPAADRAFCEGINRLVIHTSTAQRPKDGKPGFEYGAGTHFNPNVTWWEQSSGFLHYIARCQALLQRGRFVADVLYYNGDWAPNIVEPKRVDPSLGKGYDYDVCNEEVLLTRLGVQDGRLVLPDGMSYRLLVLPPATRMPVEVLLKIRDLVKGGATVVGPRPQKAPGLKDYPLSDDRIKTLAADLWGDIDGQKVTTHKYGKGRIIQGTPLREILLRDSVVPDFEYSGDAQTIIDFIHRREGATDIYFLANRNPRLERVDARFRSRGKTPRFWDPVIGAMRRVTQYREAEGRTIIPLELAPYGSLFVVFQKDRAFSKGGKGVPNFPRLSTLEEVSGAWTVRFDPAWGGPATVKFASLQDWTTRPEEGIKYYSGTATYTKQITLSPAGGRKYFLDLGQVKHIASVRLNGKDLGIVWTAPWRVEITQALNSGTNHLEVDVTNLWPNRLICDAALSPEKRLTRTNIPFKKDAALLPSGLLGPVVIQVEGSP